MRLYRDKQFFYPGTTQAQLHHEYQKAAETANVKSASIFYFSQIIQENNYSIFSPRKDLCDVCISFQNDNLSKEAYDYHILLKNETRNEKNEDKASATEKKSIWSMDLQAVLCVQNPTLVLFIIKLNCKFITSLCLTWVRRMDIATCETKVKET